MPDRGSLEGRIIGCLAKVFPKLSQPRLIVGDLLDDAPEKEPGEAKFVADAHSVIFALVGALSLLLAIGAGAAVDSLWGHTAANLAGAVLFAPVAFFMSLAVLVQVAKFRRRFDGVQPRLGRLSWAACIAIVLAVAFYVGSAPR